MRYAAEDSAAYRIFDMAHPSEVINRLITKVPYYKSCTGIGQKSDNY